ncbi:MAG: ribokinase [Spirochaetia bacterium]|jgi:ribokinase
MIIVIGSSNIDFVSNACRVPCPGETVSGKNFTVTPGGKGANQAVAVGRLGGDIKFINKVGASDKYVDTLLEGFRWAGVDLKYVEVQPDAYCGAALVMVGENGQNLITIVANANAFITPEFVKKHERLVASAGVVLVEFGIPMEAAIYAIRIAKEVGCCTIVNPAPAMPISDSFYRTIDVITPNETEAWTLTGIKVRDIETADRATSFFHKKGVPQVVITLGCNGAYVSSNGRKEWVPGYAVKAVDATAAGDAFNGGLAYAIDSGADVFRAARFACAVGALCVTRSGSSRSMPTLSEVESFMATAIAGKLWRSA